MENGWHNWAAALGASGVALGAFGAHALKQVLLQRNSTESWKTAVTYQLVHAVSLIALSALPGDRKQIDIVGKLWVSGTIMFSTSIYALSLGGPKLLGPITPIGGLLMIGGWVSLGLVDHAGRRN